MDTEIDIVNDSTPLMIRYLKKEEWMLYNITDYFFKEAFPDKTSKMWMPSIWMTFWVHIKDIKVGHSVWTIQLINPIHYFYFIFVYI